MGAEQKVETTIDVIESSKTREKSWLNDSASQASHVKSTTKKFT
jgi:hypothetical protein